MNKKSWRLVLGLVSITFFIYLFHRKTSFSATTFNSPSSLEQASIENVSNMSQDVLPPPLQEDKMAFVTFLCDDVMVNERQVDKFEQS